VWGSFGFFGPLTIEPELWDRGIAQRLLARTMGVLDERGVRNSGLFTFPHSTKHVSLYQKFRYLPRFLTSIMVESVAAVNVGCNGYSTLGEEQKSDARRECRGLTDSIHSGLDVSGEIEAVDRQRLGETVLLWDGDRLDGFAVCFCGEGTEGGRDN